MLLKSMILCAAAYSFDKTDTKSQWINICSNMDHVLEYSTSLDVKPVSLIVLTWHESRWRYGSRSEVGACGIAQVVPKYTRPRVSCRSLQDPEVGLLYGAKALRQWLNTTDNNLTRAYCHYNCGNECFDQGLDYARDVMRSYRRFNKIKRGIESLLENIKLFALNSFTFINK